MADACLFVMTATELFAISLGKLLSLGKEIVVPSESLPPPPFFNANLPKEGWGQELHHHFVFDSELYVAIGGVDDVLGMERYFERGTRVEEIRACPFDSYVSPDHYCEIYRLDVERRVFAEADHRIHRLPTPLAPCFVGNISGDVYSLAYHRSDLVDGNGFWRLSSSGKSELVWESLPPPPHDDDDIFNNCNSFVFQDKLFLQLYADPTVMYSFDPNTKQWTSLDEDTVDSFERYIYECSESVCFPSVPMSHLSNCSVGLLWSISGAPDDYIEVTIEALLVDNENGAAILCQQLDECFDGINPFTFNCCRHSSTFIDLGNGMVCALFFGYSMPQTNIPVLCISVFTLTVMEANIDINTGTAAAPEYKNFLSVTVHVMRAFNMKDYKYLTIKDSFLFPPPKKELPQ